MVKGDVRPATDSPAVEKNAMYVRNDKTSNDFDQNIPLQNFATRLFLQVCFVRCGGCDGVNDGSADAECEGEEKMMISATT